MSDPDFDPMAVAQGQEKLRRRIVHDTEKRCLAYFLSVLEATENQLIDQRQMFLEDDHLLTTEGEREQVGIMLSQQILAVASVYRQMKIAENMHESFDSYIYGESGEVSDA